MNSNKQNNLFLKENMALTISDASKFFSVSSATIRNWIKTGHLETIDKGKISLKSILNFKKTQIGKNKLNQRANKSQKEIHNHQDLTSNILDKINNADANTLGDFYESNLSDTYKNKEGIYYTPQNIVKSLFKIFDDISDKTFCDPCCGSGNFIMRAIELGFKPENIYGYDIDPIAVEITKKRIYQETGYITKNIQQLDFLQSVANNHKLNYDYIYTNPPWGKKIDKTEKLAISEKLNSTLNNDTCALFFSACLNVLNDRGTLGLLLPESFFNIASFENSRNELLQHQIKYLVDYGKAFKGLQTGAVAFILGPNAINQEELILCEYDTNLFYRTKKSFLNNPKKIINLYANDKDEEIISYLFSTPHINLEKNAKWGLGIVTGNNKEHIKEREETGTIPIFKGSDITDQGLKPPTNFIYPHFSMYQQVAPLDLFNAKEKLIYKFISSELYFYYDTDQRFILNSANMLITKNNFPVSMKTLAQVFNSHLMRWLFKKVFNTHKILRGDLESLPIYPQYLNNVDFNELDYLDKLNLEAHNGTIRIKN